MEHIQNLCTFLNKTVKRPLKKRKKRVLDETLQTKMQLKNFSLVEQTATFYKKNPQRKASYAFKEVGSESQMKFWMHSTLQ